MDRSSQTRSSSSLILLPSKTVTLTEDSVPSMSADTSYFLVMTTNAATPSATTPQSSLPALPPPEGNENSLIEKLMFAGVAVAVGVAVFSFRCCGCNLNLAPDQITVVIIGEQLAGNPYNIKKINHQNAWRHNLLFSERRLSHPHGRPEAQRSHP